MANGRTEAEWLLVSGSSKMQRIFEAAKAAARSDASVLITGENGTGKGVLAKFIHETSKRAGKFVSLDLTCIPKELLESELFGVVPRYLDSRHPGKDGRVQLAHLGSLFLDEIGDMPLDQQAKLLSFCQNRSCTSVGSNQIDLVDARVISATNRDMDARIRSGLFREDLYYRIRDIRIHLPPLRERQEDILPLVHHYLSRLASRFKIPQPSISDELGRLLLRHEWPGNLRELESCIRMMLETHRGVSELTPSCLPDDILEPVAGTQQFREAFAGLQLLRGVGLPEQVGVSRILVPCLHHLGRGDGRAAIGRDEAAVAPLLEVAVVHHLDADRIGVDVHESSPVAFTCMPSTSVEGHELRDGAIHVDQQVGGYPMGRVRIQKRRPRRHEITGGVVKHEESRLDSVIGVEVGTLLEADSHAVGRTSRELVVFDGEHGASFQPNVPGTLSDSVLTALS